jgi:hypothetical protein
VDKHYVVLLYGVLVKIAVVVFHHMLCAHLFMDSIDSHDFSNRVIFFCAGFFLAGGFLRTSTRPVLNRRSESVTGVMENTPRRPDRRARGCG